MPIKEIDNDGDKEGEERYSFRKRKSENKYDTSFIGRNILESEDDEEDESLEDKIGDVCVGGRPDTLLESKDGLAGSEVFTFKTPKGKNQMLNLAAESAKSSSNQIKNSNKCEDSMKSKDIEATPQNVRLRTRRKLTKLTEAVISSDESSDEGTSDEASEDDGDDDEDSDDGSVKTTNLIEDYFLAHGSSKITTSDRTLAVLDQPKINQEVLQDKLKNIPKKHKHRIQTLTKNHEELFKKWNRYMNHGYNILLYGLGSKHDILDNFRLNYLQDFDALVINGFFPNLTVRQILSTICEDILDCYHGFPSTNEQLNYIKKSFKERSSAKLYIIVHNIDGSTLRRNEDQHVLSVLASSKNIHFLASVDHINCSLLWDQKKSHLFSWLWFDSTNYSLYKRETSYENSMLVQHSGQLALSSLTHVFKSLTPNAQGIFMLLAKYQLENKDSSVYIGLSFQEYYQQCREAFLVNSDLTLRAQLTEFKDHKLIKVKKAADGVEHLSIPLENSTLAEFCSIQEKD